MALQNGIIEQWRLSFWGYVEKMCKNGNFQKILNFEFDI